MPALATASGDSSHLPGNRNGEFLAHYYLWKTHEALGDTDRAKFELQASRYFVRFSTARLRDNGGKYKKNLPEWLLFFRSVP